MSPPVIEPLLCQSSTRNYKVHGCLGKGAFSTVYKATHLPTLRDVAVKKVNLSDLSEKDVQLCEYEVHLLNLISSPYVIEHFESFRQGNMLYIALEFADGFDLAQKIDQLRANGRIYSERTIWYYFTQICSGLAALHHKRILHRDLKPENIFMFRNGQVKIGDLGLARLFSQNTVCARTDAGTPYYMSPERYDSGGYSFKSDIWALGCLLYEMATLNCPFEGEQSIWALNQRIRTGDMFPIPSQLYSDQLIYFVSSCMSIDPYERPTATDAQSAAIRMFECYEIHLRNYRKGVC